MMSSAAIEQMTENLIHSFEAPDRVTITADPFGGARVRVISSQFATLAPSERRDLVLARVVENEVAHLELLTPEEADFLGVPVQDPPRELDTLPLWPEALAHGQGEYSQVHLPSQTFTPLTPPVVATFYSLRGGVGRSTALAHTARILTRQGLRVLCIDMDLEAPGLASLFGIEDRVVDGKGVVPLLIHADFDGTVADLGDHLLPIGEGAELQLLPAGLPNSNYARQLALLDPAAWYREEINPLRLLIDAVRDLPQRPDVVLIDSRTGISPLAAPLLFDVADLAVVTFYPHPQARLGTAALTRALLAAHSRRSTPESPVSPEVRFVVSPVPATTEIRALYADRAQEWIREWLSPARTAGGERPFEALDDIVQVVSYQEAVAGSDSAFAVSAISDYEPIAAWAAGLVEPKDAALRTSPGESGEPLKPEILESLSFSGETAEQQGRDDLLDTFLTTEAVTRALSVQTPVVIGRKGTGKTAIFRKLAALPDALTVTSPTGTETYRSWMLGSDVYSSIERLLTERDVEWRQVWPAIIGLAVVQQRPDVPRPHWIDTRLGGAERGDYSGSDLLRDLRGLLREPDAPLLTAEWLGEIDQALGREHLLLLDALDTGFGNTEADRRRRTQSVAGLLTVVNELGPSWRNLHFKILLREDIWREVQFPNKSHLAARSARLAWADQVDYLRIALKQAWRSTPFRDLVAGRLDRPDFKLKDTSIEYWPESFVRSAWILLAGERVSGGRTAFTDNWVWARLADANGDHTPRALVQLLTAATNRERQFERENPYGKSILRPRALVESLDEVSEQTLDALSRDEFPELKLLFEALTTIGTTPFDAEQIRASPDAAALIPLAREVGLLEPTSDSRTGGDRFRVPELYRKALGMGRRGMA
jgi:MinD-like ATPase involved in chromosome partitioning or flagellar assembly